MKTIKPKDFKSYDKLDIDTEILTRNADAMYQKKIKDKHGVKYFITAYQYNWDEEDYQNTTFEFQINGIKNDIAHYVTFYGIQDKSLKEVEKHIEDFWQTEGFDYYEEY